jgi:phage-related protein
MTVLLQLLAPVAPSPGTSDKPTITILKPDFGDGVSNVRDGINNIRREMTLTWEVLQPDQANVIVSFLEARGGTTPFWWAPSDETPLKWTCKDWSDKRQQGGLRMVTAVFRQCFDPTGGPRYKSGISYLKMLNGNRIKLQATNGDIELYQPT